MLTKKMKAQDLINFRCNINFCLDFMKRLQLGVKASAFFRKILLSKK